MKKREYNVRVPFTGYYDTTVIASSEEEVIDIVLDENRDLIDIMNESDFWDWNIHENVTEGDFFHGLQHTLEIEEGEEVEDE